MSPAVAEGRREAGHAPSPHAALPFRVVGVTGTNGKTTTTTMIEAVATRAGERSGRATTLGSWVRGERLSDEVSIEAVRRTLDAAAAAKVRTMAIEMTSYALSRGVAGVLPPTVGVFTNLSRDHLDYHGTPEAYLASKAQLFMALPSAAEGGTAVLNAADPASALLDEVTPPGVRRLAYAARPVDPACAALPLALQAEGVEVDRGGTRVRLAPSPLADRLGGALRLRVLGEVHAENALAAAVAADALGYPAEAIRDALAAFAGVPGRFEVVDRGPGPLVVVDYAHTPDALERTLRLARALVSASKGRVLVVFGCGGDRDQGKRPEMGRVAAALADLVLVTTDNPRTEDPKSIVRMIFAGVEGRFPKPERITDRGRAIRRAIAIAEDPDVVVIAGKGHEKTQVFRDHAVPFDDVEVARSAPRAADGENGRRAGYEA
jgi:UDP-N-acetylmuramoyl-L-alanyl-D-glutamate--2,6-diaminopimelate ligase